MIHKKTYGLLGTGGGGGRGKEITCLSLICHHQNDPCVKIGSDESHFNVLFIAWEKDTREVSRFQGFIELLAPGG